MTYGGFDPKAQPSPMSEINVVPLIDVMVVLLVIFIVTAPLLTHSVRLDLPKAANRPTDTRPAHVQLAIDARGAVHWNGEAVDREEWRRRMAAAALADSRTELHLRADRTTAYQAIAEVLADAAQAGLTRVGFVTDPAGAP
jgi:biopolymer transport protein ExbD